MTVIKANFRSKKNLGALNEAEVTKMVPKKSKMKPVQHLEEEFFVPADPVVFERIAKLRTEMQIYKAQNPEMLD